MAYTTRNRHVNVAIKRRYKKTMTYDRYAPKYDYLKNFRVVRYWIQRNYNLKISDVEILTNLYSEGLFTRAQFLNQANLFSWDKERFDRLRNEGWIHVWRVRSRGEVNLYELTHNAKRLITSMYKKLNGEETIPESPRRNVIFKPTAGYVDRVFANAIKAHNKEIKAQRQRPSQLSPLKTHR